MGERGQRAKLYLLDDAGNYHKIAEISYANIDLEENEAAPEETPLKDICNTKIHATIGCHLRLIDLIRLFGFINGIRFWLRTPSQIFKEMMKK